MSNHIYNEYHKAKIETASPGILILLGYENIERAIENAMESCNAKDYVAMNEELIRAQKIINEFIIALDMSVGDLAQNLFKIYTAWVKTLIKANIDKDVEAMRQVLEMVKTLHESWKEAVKQVDTSTRSVQHKGFNLMG